MYCINCGTKLEDTSCFCHNCGTQVGSAGTGNSAASPVRPAVRKEQSGKKKFPIVLALVLAVAVAAAAVFLLGGEKVNPAYTAMLEEKGFEDYSILKGDTLSYLDDLGDGMVMKVEFAYKEDLVTDSCTYMFHPLGEMKFNQQYLDQLKNNSYGWDVVLMEDYYISVDLAENLDTEEGVRDYYALPAEEPVDLIEIEIIKKIYSGMEGYIPRELAE